MTPTEERGMTITYLNTPEREVATRADVGRKSWAFAQRWADGLTTAQLRQAAKLNVPGDAGLAVDQELGRRQGARSA